MKILMIDNYDSFTYNLVQYLGELGADVDVVRNDVEQTDALLARGADGVVVSPGPGVPQDALGAAPGDGSAGKSWLWANAPAFAAR